MIKRENTREDERERGGTRGSLDEKWVADVCFADDMILVGSTKDDVIAMLPAN